MCVLPVVPVPLPVVLLTPLVGDSSNRAENTSLPIYTGPSKNIRRTRKTKELRTKQQSFIYRNTSRRSSPKESEKRLCKILPKKRVSSSECCLRPKSLLFDEVDIRFPSCFMLHVPNQGYHKTWRKGPRSRLAVPMENGHGERQNGCVGSDEAPAARSTRNESEYSGIRMHCNHEARGG